MIMHSWELAMGTRTALPGRGAQVAEHQSPSGSLRAGYPIDKTNGNEALMLLWHDNLRNLMNTIYIRIKKCWKTCLRNIMIVRLILSMINTRQGAGTIGLCVLGPRKPTPPPAPPFHTFEWGFIKCRNLQNTRKTELVHCNWQLSNWFKSDLWGWGGLSWSPLYRCQ